MNYNRQTPDGNTSCLDRESGGDCLNRPTLTFATLSPLGEIQ